MLHLGLEGERAALCARLFAETTRDGVYTHGVNRFLRFVEMIRNGSIDVLAEPTRVSGHGAIERWNGHLAPGNISAYGSMHRAMELAREHGLGCVALGNTNHWLRGGTYGWLAADEGFVAMCWTNTLPNLPAWGATNPVLGNNPLVIAAPRPSGNVVVDMAMSQFSYGTLAAYAQSGKLLPVDGGFDTTGNLTRDAAAIEASQRALPVGYWKGSALSFILDLIGAMLGAGLATHQLTTDYHKESGISQIFLAIDPSRVAAAAELNQIADNIVASLQHATPIDPAHPVRYPGQKTLQLREENMRLGVPVDEKLWRQLHELSF